MGHLDDLCAEICRSAQALGYKIPGKISARTQRIGSFNSGIAPGSDVIIFDSQTAALSTALAGLIAKCFPAGSLNKSPQDMIRDVDKDPLEEELRIDGNDCREFKQGYLNFIKTPDNAADAWPKLDGGIAEQIRDGFVLFALGHELGHIILGHCGYGEQKTVDTATENWDQELDADALGYEFMTDAMSRLYPDVPLKAQHNIGAEAFFLYPSIGNLLSLIFSGEEFTTTHPDWFTRLNRLRQKIESGIPPLEHNGEPETPEYAARAIEIGFPRHIMEISDEVYAAYKKKIIDEVLVLAAKHGSHRGRNEFMSRLWKDFCSTTDSFPDLDLPGIQEWKEGRYTRALRSLIAGKIPGGIHGELSRILAVLYRYEYDYLASKMDSCLGQLPEFRNGVDDWREAEYLCLTISKTYGDNVPSMVKRALNCAQEASRRFQIVRDEESGPRRVLAEFAKGRAESVCGWLRLSQGDIRNAIDCFTADIDNSPAARDSFRGRSRAYKLAGNKKAARADDEAWKIIRQAPSFLDRSRAYFTTGLRWKF